MTSLKQDVAICSCWIWRGSASAMESVRKNCAVRCDGVIRSLQYSSAVALVMGTTCGDWSHWELREFSCHRPYTPAHWITKMALPNASAIGQSRITYPSEYAFRIPLSTKMRCRFQ